MSNYSNSFHHNCLFGCKIIRRHNRRTLALTDTSCSGSGQVLIYSKEKWKNLFDKKRINSLVYLEGLEILKDLRIRKQKEK
jgi:hypothetical protein